MSALDERHQLVERWASLLDGDARRRHPLYAQLCDAAPSHRALVDPLEHAPAAQRRPNLLLAAVHHLCLRLEAVELAPWYPTLRWMLQLDGDLDAPDGDPPPPGPLPDGGLEAVLSFLKAHSAEVASLLATRSTQTNEPGRSAALLYGLRQLTGEGRAVALIDLGASAGLNLHPERYQFALSDGTILGDPSSSVCVDVEIRGAARPGFDPPIAWRRGLDLRPLDARNDEDARWLLACQWPDDPVRFERTRRALRLARAETEPVIVEQGDVVDDLDALVALAPAELHLVVFHSWMAAYLTEERQRALRDRLEAVAATRPLSWLWFEHPSEVPGLAPPAVPGKRLRGSSILVLEEPGRGPAVLAQAHPHGTWLAPVS